MKNRLLVFTVLHQCPTILFQFGEPFYARQRFGWDAGQIALTQALSGLCIAVGAYIGGQIAHHKSPRQGMRIGLIGCVVTLLLGWAGASRGGAVTLTLSLMVMSFFQAFVWPGLEAALVRDEPPAGVQRYVSLYNLVWSVTTAIAFFFSTPLMSAFGLQTLYLAPAVFYFIALLFLQLALPLSPALDKHSVEHPDSPPVEAVSPKSAGVSRADAYRWMGWIANPCAYVAIIVIVTYNPTVQQRLGLRFEEASAWCSLWLYVRPFGFELLRRWTWWHYRWPFLCLMFGVTMASFAGITLAPTLVALLAAQVAFGLSLGLLYQSSLFYSMSESDAQGEHGGFHECAIGLGAMMGPLVAYGGQRLVPGSVVFPILVVLGLMSLGLTALLVLGLRYGRDASKKETASF